MAPSTPATHDPALSHAASAAQASQPPQLPAGLSTNLSAADLSNLALSGGLDQAQIMTLLRTFPVLAKVSPCSHAMIITAPSSLPSDQECSR